MSVGWSVGRSDIISKGLSPDSTVKKNNFVAYHFVVYLVEVYLADLVDHVLVLVDDEPEPAVPVRLLVEHQHHVLDLNKHG